MGSVVLELQQDALNRNVSVSDLLRKALVVARKLGLAEMQAWIKNELGGYGEAGDCPPYREVTGQVMGWNPYRGWIPVGFDDHGDRRRFSRRKCGQSIAELESLVEGSTQGAAFHMPFPADQTLQLSSGMALRTQLSLFTQRAAIVGIIDAVRTGVLNWAIKLEEEGVLGEDLTFSAADRATAATATQNVTNFYAPVAGVTVQQAGSDSIQVSATAPDLKSIATFLTSLREALPKLALSKDDQAELSAEVETLEVQAKSPRPKASIIKESLRSVRSILEGAAGAAAGQLLLAQVTKLLGG